MNIVDAKETLSSHKLNPRLSSLGENHQITGFLEAKLEESANETSKGYYAIYFEDNKWTAALPGVPFDTIISQSPNLDDVVNEVCNFYNLTETTIPDATTIEEAVKLLRVSGLTVVAQYDDTIWGEDERQVGTSEEVIAQRFGIHQHAGTWIAIHFRVKEFNRLIKYSNALGDVVQAVIRYFRGMKT